MSTISSSYNHTAALRRAKAQVESQIRALQNTERRLRYDLHNIGGEAISRRLLEATRLRTQIMESGRPITPIVVRKVVHG